MAELLTNEQISQMFRDFGLCEEVERQRLLALGRTVPQDMNEGRTLVFVRTVTTSDEQGDSDAKLAQHS